MDGPEKANGRETSAVYSLGGNDLLGNILYSGGSAGKLLISIKVLAAFACSRRSASRARSPDALGS